MIKKIMPIFYILLMSLMLASSVNAASYDISVDGLGSDGMDIAGFTFWLNVGHDFQSTDITYGPAVPKENMMTWAIDNPHKSHFGASDMGVLFGNPLVPLSNGTLVSFNYEGTFNLDNPFELVKFTTTDGDDLFKGGKIIIKSLSPEGAVFAPVPIPGAVWLLGAGLIGLAGYSRKKRQ